MRTLICIPTLNERPNIGVLLLRIVEQAPQCEILVLDDASRDGTALEVQGYQSRFPQIHLLERKPPPGFSRSYIDGFHWAFARDFELVVTMDADLSHDPGHLPHMLSMAKECEVVIGSRYIQGGSVENWPLRRRLLSRFANMYARFCLELPVHDVTSGFGVYRRSALEGLPLHKLRSDGYAFLVEVKYLLACAGVSFGEVPICFRDRTAAASKMRFSTIVESALMVPRLRFSRLLQTHAKLLLHRVAWF